MNPLESYVQCDDNFRGDLFKEKVYLLIFGNNHNIRSVYVCTQFFVPVALNHIVILMIKQNINTGRGG